MSGPTPIEVPAGLRGLAGHDPGTIDDLRTLRESLEARSSLDERTMELVRLAVMVAIRAPEGSIAAHVKRLARMGAPTEDVWSVLLAIAPLVGVPALIDAGPKFEAALEQAGGEQ